MSEAEQLDDAPVSAPPEEGSEAWRESMVGVMRNVLMRLPDDTSLGQIVEAATANPTLEPALRALSIQELIDIAVARPIRGNADEAVLDDDLEGDSEEFDDGGAAVIRRRADIPDGDLIVLGALAEKGPMSETQLMRATRLTSEQLRLLLRGLRTKSYVHVEGSGQKRKIKITRNGGGFLRKRSGSNANAGANGATPAGGGRRRRRRR